MYIVYKSTSLIRILTHKLNNNTDGRLYMYCVPEFIILHKYVVDCSGKRLLLLRCCKILPGLEDFKIQMYSSKETSVVAKKFWGE